VVHVTAQNAPRLSVAALVAIKPGQRPRLIYRTHRRRRASRRRGFTETHYAALLDAGHQQLGGPIVLVWDNLDTHTSKAMAELIAARPWLTVHRLPPYAHELNPVEPVWAHLKRSLANLTKQTLTELTALVKTRLKRLQHRPGLLASFLVSTGLEFRPFMKPLPLRIFTEHIEVFSADWWPTGFSVLKSAGQQPVGRVAA
jgi:hypothetical protein